MTVPCRLDESNSSTPKHCSRIVDLWSGPRRLILDVQYCGCQDKNVKYTLDRTTAVLCVLLVVKMTVSTILMTAFSSQVLPVDARRFTGNDSRHECQQSESRCMFISDFRFVCTGTYGRPKTSVMS